MAAGFPEVRLRSPRSNRLPGKAHRPGGEDGVAIYVVAAIEHVERHGPHASAVRTRDRASSIHGVLDVRVHTGSTERIGFLGLRLLALAHDTHSTHEHPNDYPKQNHFRHATSFPGQARF
jgi:hypothetical protein